MTEPDNGRQSAQGEGIAQAYGAGASASVEVHHHHYPTAAAASWNWPRPWDFAGYISEKRSDFTGRSWLFDEVREWYEDENGAQALLVCADFGVGKSAFMAELTSDAHGLQIAAWHFCDHNINARLNPATFVRSVAAQFAASLPEYKAAVEGDADARRWLDEVQLDPASAFERAVIGPLNGIRPPCAPQVLLVDALDEALDFKITSGTSRAATIVGLLANQARHLPAWLRILATSRRIQDVLQPIQSAFRCPPMLDGEDARNLDDIRTFVAGRCARAPLARALETGHRSAGDIAAFLSDAEQSGGKFLYAVRVLNDLESGALPLDRLSDLPPGMDGFYLDAFGRRFPESEDFAPVGALLGVLCVQREPLSRAELAAILGTTEVRVRKILKRLEDFLQVRAKRYAFDHLSLAQWLSEENEDGFPRAGRFVVALKDAEPSIADWARRELAADRAHESVYLARHLDAYLSPQERKLHFARLLVDFRWLDARLRAAGINALLMDWADVDRTPSLEALAQALRHGAHVLGHEGSDWRGSDLLASQILGRLQSRAELEVRALCAQAAGGAECNAGWRPLTDSLRSAEALLRTLKGNRRQIIALAVLADGRLASGMVDGEIRLWNLASGGCEARLVGPPTMLLALTVLADGRLASGSMDYTIQFWHPTSGVCEATLEGHTATVLVLAVLADGRLASGSGDHTIRLWNSASRVCEATLEGHTGPVLALAGLTDGRLASGSGDKTIRLWNPASGACEATLEGHTDGVSALAVLADGRLASGSKDHTIRLWNPVSGVCEASLEGQTSGEGALAVLSDGRLASEASHHTIRLWNPASGVWETRLEGHTDTVSALAALSDGRLASGSFDTTIKLWNPASGECEATPEGHTSGVSALAVLADGRLASGSKDATIRLWNPACGVCVATLEQHKREVSALAVLADGRLASADNHLIRLWNPANSLCEVTFNGHKNQVSVLAVLADGRFASCAMFDITIRLWNPGSGVCEAMFDHTAWVSALAVLPDGRLVSGSWDSTIRLWNPASGVCEATLEGHTDTVSALAVLADGRLVSGSSDGSIRTWQDRNGRWTGTVRFVADVGITALAFAARAGVLAAGDASGRVHFLKVESARTCPA